ncbi:MAG TPA: hypothetical protein VL524_05580 [Gemmatimonadaceae bacterium]|jgi:hypothetical protein|nr:hypothetical protein [Gemmatimonadaceae bacterium]
MAQSATSLLTDASVVPRGRAAIEMRFSPLRWDALLGTPTKGSSTQNIAWSFNADSVGTHELPLLAPAETAIRTLTNSPNFLITAGKLVSIANSRVLTVPLIVQYGVTSRLTVGFVVPLVETRSLVDVRLNPLPGFANVGPNPALAEEQLRVPSAALVNSLRAASSDLEKKLTACQATPTDPACASLLGQRAEAEALVQSGDAFAAAIEQLYGTNPDHPGQPFVPLAGSLVQGSIDFQIQRIAARFQSYLGSDVITGSVTGAVGAPANAALQSLLTAAGRDTIAPIDRSSIGDISIGATYQLVNTFSDSMSTRGYRLALNGTFRLGTGEPADRNRLFDVGTGYGQNGVEIGAAADVQLGRRFSGTALASYALQLGTVNVGRVPTTANALLPLTSPTPGTFSAGNVLQATVKPRIRIAGFLAIHGLYTLTHVAADQYTLGPAVTDSSGNVLSVAPAAPFGLAAATTHQLGFGFSYSTIASGDARPIRLPFELSFNHLETIAASGGPVPKTFRDQLSVRVYFGR